jgi:hypothetical protein
MKKYNNVAIVVTAYKIYDDVVARFFKYNHHDNIYCVTDAKTPEWVTRIQCPEMAVFAITRAANIGINKAIIDGHDVIIKTDIDCIITDEVLDFCRNLKIGNGACFRYWHIKNPSELNHTELDKRCIGTAVMHADDWLRINGYNEYMDGYGYDDGDLRTRARGAGIIFPTLTNPKIYHIWHEVKHNRDTINPVNRAKNIAARNKM